MAREIVFYRGEDGNCPLDSFLDKLPEKDLQKVLWVLRLVSELERIPACYFKKLVATDEIYECRIQSGSNSYRIFCFFHKGTIIVLTNGIAKKTQKTPAKEIKRAEILKKDFLERQK